MPDTGHPDWDHLLAALESAIAPTTTDGRPDRRAKARDVLPPVVLLRGEGAPQDVYKVDQGLLHPNTRRHAHAETLVPGHTPPGDGVRPLCRDIDPDVLKQGVLQRTGRLKLPNFSLARRIVDGMRAAGGPSGPTALRDYCYAHERGPLRNALWQAAGMPQDGGAGGGLTVATVWNWLAGPLCQALPRWLWGRRWTRRLLRAKRHRWYAEWVNRDRTPLLGAEFFTHAFNRVGALVAADAPGGLSAAERERRLEQLLLRALLVDLARWGRAGRWARLSPWRRRRVTRYVLSVHLPEGPEGEAGERGVRFLEEYAAAVQWVACAPVLVLADCTGATVPVAGGERHGLAEAAGVLRAARGVPAVVRPLLVELDDTLPAGVPASDRAPKRRLAGPGAEATAWCVAAGLVLGGAGWTGWDPGGPGTDCVGAATGEVSAPTARDGTPALATEYEEARAMIEGQNALADEAARQGHTVRTVAYIGVGMAGSDEEWEARSDGAVPELRGVALAQRELNQEASTDRQKVWLRVELYDRAGEKYAEGEALAEEIAADAAAAEAAAEAEAGSPEEIIGVVGFAQSREETRAAVRIFEEARIPVVATTATADAMNSGTYYHQLAPPNSREAQITSQFARETNIVRTAPGECAPAEAAVVIQDPDDLYSASLGDGFATLFADAGGSWRKLWHSPDTQDLATPPPSDPRVTWEPSIHDVAQAVCDEVRSGERADAGTVVYWTARSREFQAFLTDYEDSTPCGGDPLTIVGGNELTNAALSGLYATPDWLRLYHTAHVLPVGESPGHMTRAFNDAYAARFGRDDLWRNDGHAALAYDAMQVLAEAANGAFEATGGQEISRSTVHNELHDGIEKEGASGHIDFAEGEAVSQNKPLVILHHTEAGSEPVLACGWFSQTEGPVDCPR
jgi:ABC-type branched-subunit amino acid transport system substrate-binding protein